MKFSDLICVRVVQSLAHKTLNIRGFSLLCKETLYPLVIFPHTPQLSVSDFFCLIGTFQINGIIPYVVFCDWFLPFNVMSSVFIFVVLCYHYFYGQRISHCTDRHINPPSPHLDIFYVYQLVDIWVVGTIWLVWIMLLWMFICKILCGHIILFSWIKLEIEYLGCMIRLQVTFWEIVRFFSIITEPFYIPTRNIWGFQFFHLPILFIIHF